MAETFEERMNRLQQSLVFPGSGISDWKDGTPTPTPIEIKLSDLESPTKEALAVFTGLFSSLTQARKNNFSGPLVVGDVIKRKLKPNFIIV